MSTCISNHGEFSEHTFNPAVVPRFTCLYCWAFDQDAALKALAEAEVRLAGVRRVLDDESANLADDGARLSHSVVRRIEAVLDGKAPTTKKE